MTDLERLVTKRNKVGRFEVIACPLQSGLLPAALCIETAFILVVIFFNEDDVIYLDFDEVLTIECIVSV